jgi:CheY-like chemotaxis protein
MASLNDFSCLDPLIFRQRFWSEARKGLFWIPAWAYNHLFGAQALLRKGLVPVTILKFCYKTLSSGHLWNVQSTTFLLIKIQYKIGENSVTQVMIVDDEPHILAVLKGMLQKEGYEVLVADSGVACLEILKDEKDKTNKDINICMLTIKSTSKDREQSLYTGADWHISKPVSKENLLETVRWLLTNPFE